MNDDKAWTEYVIEAPGRGYLGQAGLCTYEQSFAGGFNHPYEGLGAAEDALKQRKLQYRNMGCPEVAEGLRIVERQARLTYSEFEPVTQASK